MPIAPLSKFKLFPRRLMYIFRSRAGDRSLIDVVPKYSVCPMCTSPNDLMTSQDLKDYFRAAGEITYTNVDYGRQGEG